MSKKKKRKGYFYEKEEQAVVDYINAKTAEEKDSIFRDVLEPAFTIMIESIIRRYHLFVRDEAFEETFDDTMAFIITKIDKYKQGSGRAYSYIGTICRNYLIGKINETNKNMVRNVPFDDVYDDILNSDEYLYSIDGDEDEMSKVILYVIDNIKKEIKENKKLKENDIIIGNSIVQILKNRDDLFAEIGSNKFLKSSIMLFIKDVTNLETKEIRKSMNKYKTLYFKTKNDYFEGEF